MGKILQKLREIFGSSNEEIIATTNYTDCELEYCLSIGAEHVGGPGAPDCASSQFIYELKNWKYPISAHTIRELARKPWVAKDSRTLIVCCPAGYTDGAIEEAERAGIILGCPSSFSKTRM